MTDLRAAAQQALEALEYLNVTAEHRVDDRIPDAAIVALRAALEQEEQKAVALCDPAEYDDFQGAVSRNQSASRQS
jgi:hypothetical protein